MKRDIFFENSISVRKVYTVKSKISMIRAFNIKSFLLQFKAMRFTLTGADLRLVIAVNDKKKTPNVFFVGLVLVNINFLFMAFSVWFVFRLLLFFFVKRDNQFVFYTFEFDYLFGIFCLSSMFVWFIICKRFTCSMSNKNDNIVNECLQWKL